MKEGDEPTFPRRFWQITALYALLFAASLPLALGWVPPNRWYGFRLPGLQHDPALWYAINAVGGSSFAAAMAACACINGLIFWQAPEPMRKLALWINGALIALSVWWASLQVLERWPH